jgi:hypothetical protein
LSVRQNNDFGIGTDFVTLTKLKTIYRSINLALAPECFSVSFRRTKLYHNLFAPHAKSGYDRFKIEIVFFVRHEIYRSKELVAQAELHTQAQQTYYSTFKWHNSRGRSLLEPGELPSSGWPV